MDTVKRIAKRMSPKENRKSYKEECSVFLSHRKKESLWERISIWKEDVICIYQRLRYGYCYRDIWSIDQWFLTVVPNMIHDLRVNSHGYPRRYRKCARKEYLAFAKSRKLCSGKQMRIHAERRICMRKSMTWHRKNSRQNTACSVRS